MPRTLWIQLLTLARMQSQQSHGEQGELDAVEVLAQIVEDARFEAGMKQAQVSLLGVGSFVTRGHEELLYRAFENVVRNAVRYTAPGSVVRVEAVLVGGGDQLQVHIVDQGPGVEPTRLQSIFEPFDRGGQSGADGFGLGLAIARRAIGLHQGSISAKASGAGGLCMTILLPRLG
jgi:two-component system, OmpR family, sensor kinase